MKNILIIGTDRGLGLALTHKFLDNDWDVTATVQESDNVEEINKLKKEFNDRLTILHVDITKIKSVKKLCESLQKDKLFDIVYSNAGVWGPLHQSAAEVTDEESNVLFMTNTIGPIRLARRVMDNLKDGGTLCFMSSFRGSVDRNVEGGMELYRASKAALNMMARGLFSEYNRKNITVLHIHPGWVETAMGTLDGTVSAEISVKESIDGVYQVVLRNMGSKKNLYLDYKNIEWAW